MEVERRSWEKKGRENQAQNGKREEKTQGAITNGKDIKEEVKTWGRVGWYWLNWGKWVE